MSNLKAACLAMEKRAFIGATIEEYKKNQIKKELKKHMAATYPALLPLAGLGLAKGVMLSGARDPDKRSDKYKQGLLNLKEFAENNRVKINDDVMNPLLNGGYGDEKAIKRNIKKLIGLGKKDSANYFKNILKDGYKGISITNEIDHMGVMGHELGHSRAGRIMSKIEPGRYRPLGTAAAFAGILGASKLEDKDQAMAAGIGGTLAYTPTMISEIDASLKGNKIMRKLKAPGAWRTFGGLASYLGMGIAPTAMYHTMNKNDKYKNT